MEPLNDPLWEIAKSRAKFKKSLLSFLIVIPFLWCVWYFTESRHKSYLYFDEDQRFGFHIPWPAWVMLFWGFGLACKFVGAYIFNMKQSIESEYESLKHNNK